MNSLLFLAASLPSASSLVGLLIWVAIFAIVLWGILALLKWAGIAIPQPVIIVFICFVSILLILLIAKAFGLAL